MSLVKNNFYNIFWNNRTCRNLFLLSKEELLETISIGDGSNPYTYSINKLIISNTENNDEEFKAIKFRNEHNTNAIDISLEDKIEYFKPILEDFFGKHLKKPIDRLIEDVEKKGWRMFVKLIKILSNEKTREQRVIKELQEYGFIGKHLKSFNEIESYLENKLIPKKNNQLINEQTINRFLEGLKFVKELYINHSYKRLYSTNQILVNTLNSEDNFESRLSLFRLLYESKILLPISSEDAFIECSNCEPNVYKGVFKLQVSPKKLKDFKCPLCKSELKYFVPYKLDDSIYKIIKNKDGLLLDALTNKLEKYNFIYKTNQTFSNDIEVDCIYDAILNDVEVTYIVETKMLKLNTEINKLKNKIRKHYGKLINDVTRLQEIDEFKGKILKPLLLVNVTDENLITEINNELKSNNPYTLNQHTEVMNIEFLNFN